MVFLQLWLRVQVVLKPFIQGWILTLQVWSDQWWGSVFLNENKQDTCYGREFSNWNANSAGLLTQGLISSGAATDYLQAYTSMRSFRTLLFKVACGLQLVKTGVPPQIYWIRICILEKISDNWYSCRKLRNAFYNPKKVRLCFQRTLSNPDKVISLFTDKNKFNWFTSVARV